jgi:hypothetical protein
VHAEITYVDLDARVLCITNVIYVYIYIYIYIYMFNRNWVDTRWQQHITHLHTNNTQNKEKGENTEKE